MLFKDLIMQFATQAFEHLNKKLPQRLWVVNLIWHPEKNISQY